MANLLLVNRTDTNIQAGPPYSSNKFYFVRNHNSIGYRTPGSSYKPLSPNQAIVLNCVCILGAYPDKYFYRNGILKGWVADYSIVTPKHNFINQDCTASTALIEYVHTLDAQKYSEILQKLKNNAHLKYINFLVAYDGNGRVCVVEPDLSQDFQFWNKIEQISEESLNYNAFRMVQIHKATSFTLQVNYDSDSRSTTQTIDERNKVGFFFGDGYFEYKRIIQQNFFIYDKNLLTLIIGPTSSNRVLNAYNSSSKQSDLQICKCTKTRQSSGKTAECFYMFKIPEAIKEDNGNSSSEDLEQQYDAGALRTYLDMGTSIDFGYVAPNGTTNKPQDYITNLNAYKLKFVRGIDNRKDRLSGADAFIAETNIQKINMIEGRNTLYVAINKRNVGEGKKSDKEPLSVLPNVDTYGDLQAFGKTLDSLNSNESPYYLTIKDTENQSIGLEQYFTLPLEDKKKYKFTYYKRGETGPLTDFTSFKDYIDLNNEFWKNKFFKTFSVDFTVDENTRNKFNLESLELVEAFTRGRDFLQHSYSTVRPQEQDSQGNKLIDFEDNFFLYKYSGREFCLRGTAAALVHEKDLLLETDVTLGETYDRQTYFIEAIKYLKNSIYNYKDTFLVKDFLKEIGNTEYTEDDYEIIEGRIELNQCGFYEPDKATYENGWCDCSFGGKNDKECYYQKCGVCPYRFTSEKHPRRIRTLQQSKSNRFNLIQELSKVFEIYPQFLIEFDANGHIKLDEQGRMKKHIAFMTEKGSVNYAGFRYEKNLAGINRSVDSQAITTKLYVETVDSEIAKNGGCSIQTAPDNIGRNSYVLDLSYYTKKGLLNPEQTQRDIWGIDNTDMAFMPTIGKYNQQYDDLTTLIILNDKELTELEAKVTTSTTGVTTALEERKKNSQKLYQFKVAQYEKSQGGTTTTIKYTVSDTYTSYLEKYQEQATILFGLVEDLFFSGNKFAYIDRNSKAITLIDLDKDYREHSEYPYSFINDNKDKYCKGELWWRLEIEGDNATFDNWPQFKEEIIDKNLYTSTGLLGQYVGFYNQNKEYKKQQQITLNKIKEIAGAFYKIYEPYIKEGTWTDSNYLTDNEYYWAANDVLHNSSKPQVTYDINVVDISPIEEFEEDYIIDIGDTTYVEDIDFFDINPRTGLPNREKVIVSEITDSLDVPTENSIKTQNYTTQFEDLFENITATVQSLTYNENTYKRASNFTAQQYIQSDSLQGTLDEGNLTLIDANDSNIVLDDSGTEGSGITNKASKYKLTGEGLYFSTDGGETWDIGVGPQGWNLDYAKFGQLDVSKVQIIDGKYIYFLWDKNGINAYRNPATSTNGLVDFARFNKYGLSLIEKGHIRLRAGYEFKNNQFGENLSGNYEEELDLTNQNVGFYLYNDKGQPIFKTETASEYNDDTTDYSARLSLKGEMFITNTNLSDDKIATGQTIASGKTLKLSQGYEFENTLGYTKEDSVYLTNYQTYIVNSEGEPKNRIVIEPNKTFSGVVYNFGGDSIKTSSEYMEITPDGLVPITSYKEREIHLWSGSLTNTTSSTITLVLDQTVYNKIVNRDIEGLNIVGDSQTPLNVTITIDATKLLKPQAINILKSYSEDASFTFNTTDVQISESDVDYYENQVKVTKKLIAYKAISGDKVYYYWGKKQEVEIEIAASKISTRDVGIFINNKLAASQGTEIIDDDEGGTRTAQIATSGNERVFMVGLRGKENNKTVFRNVISALKNGVLYIGGEIQSELGTSLGDISFDTLPDKVRITNASMIVANNGYIWADWSKFFNIKNGQLMTEEGSLQDYFEAIGEAFGNASRKGTGDVPVEGYYLEEPLL